MVSNLGIEKDNEMSKLRPSVDLLGGFFTHSQIHPNFDTSLFLEFKGQCHENFCFCLLSRVPRGSAGCGVAQQGAAWLSRVWRGSAGCGVAQ
jgi:hypothetical protein